MTGVWIIFGIWASISLAIALKADTISEDVNMNLGHAFGAKWLSIFGIIFIATEFVYLLLMGML